jgi:hypothetical protein
MKISLVAVTFFLAVGILSGRGKLLPPVTSADFSDSIIIERPHYFPPREIHSFACGGLLIDPFCWNRDPTFDSSGKETTVLGNQGDLYKISAQFIFVNDSFSNDRFKEIVFAVEIDGIVMEFNFDEVDISPTRWTVPVIVGGKGADYCFAYDDNSKEPEASMSTICINTVTRKILAKQLGLALDKPPFVVDFIGASEHLIFERFCKGENRNEYLAQLLTGNDC